MRPDVRVLRLRWVVYGGAAALYLVAYVHRVAPAVVAADLMRDFAITATTLGTLSSIYPYVFAVMALIAGSLVETLGPRWTLTLGGLTMSAGAAIFGVATVFWVAYGGRLLVGLGASVILIAWLTLSAEWFRPSEFATVSGSTQGVGNLGALIASTPLALVVDGLGWRHTFVLIGAATLALTALVAAVIRDRPEAMGLPPLNPRRARAGSLGEAFRGIPDVLGNPRTWPPAIAAGGVYATQLALLGLWGVPALMQGYGMERVRAATAVALVAVGMMIGSPLVGFVSDRWLGRRRRPFVIFTAVYAACWLPLAVPALALPPAALPPLFFVMGLAGSGLVLVWSCLREVNDPARVGIVLGFANMPIFLAVALLQWLMGVVLDAGWDGAMTGGARLYPARAYAAAFGLCLAFCIVAVIAATRVTETRCRNVWRPPGSSPAADAV